jgi:hypothetical protein
MKNKQNDILDKDWTMDNVQKQYLNHYRRIKHPKGWFGYAFEASGLSVPRIGSWSSSL